MPAKPELAAATKTAQLLRQTDSATGGLSPALHPSSTYARDADYELVNAHYSYGRDDNFNYAVVEKLLAELEHGAAALLFGSGSAAAMAVVQSLRPGDRIVAPRIMYWGLRNRLTEFCAIWGLRLDFFDTADPESLQKTVSDADTNLVWIESPCNPTWDIIDIQAAARIAHAAGARLIVDSTVATPVLTQPIDLGADLVLHSATKYLNGHCDVVAGAVISATDDDFWQRVCHERFEGGAILGAFEAWLLQRGMRTLFLRVQKASESALRIARHFEGHDRLGAVLYPGLLSHPGHSIANQQMQGGFGGMLSLRVTGGESAALAVARHCKVFTRATSLGGVESLIEHRYSIEGSDSPIPQDLLRLSIGIEAVDDLIADLEQALQQTCR